MKILDKYYEFFFGPDVFLVAQKLGLTINFVIEAGCHDGSDTLKFLKNSSVKMVYAFEPDHNARERALKLCATEIPHRVELSPFALSNKNERMYLHYGEASAGSGTTRLVAEGTDAIETRRLDDCLPNLPSTGLLWLDVEGHAVPALQGSLKTLRNIQIAKMEVQTHEMGPGRKADFLPVIRIMKKAGMVPLYGPLHPGYFGDLIFARESEITLFRQYQSIFLSTQLFLLHIIVYPLLGKAKPIV